MKALRGMKATGACVVEQVGEADELAAITILETYDDKGFSLCDALRFAVMDRRHVTRAISFDQHFRRYGNGKFEVLPWPPHKDHADSNTMPASALCVLVANPAARSELVG